VEPAVLLESVSKSFGGNRAVANLDLRVEPGTIYGLLGPNGSGKSTTMKMIIGLAKPDSGAISVCGINVLKDPMGVKGIIGYVPETPRLYEFLTGIEYLDFIGDAYGLETGAKGQRISQFLEAFDLEGREDEMIGGYSHGMKQKVAIIGALLHEPKLLILDEHLAGLDPKSARIMKDLLKSLAGREVATILSTHVLEIADAVCDKVCVMYRGEKVGDETPSELRRISRMTESSLEEVFLKLTGSGDLKDIVEALSD
jgi:ABC-2 type transport system ATP-binding protein